MFKTELHCHTSPVSPCGTLPPEELAAAYRDAGYTTVVLTNHLARVSFEPLAADGREPTWEEKMDYYLADFHRLQAAAGDLHVLLGAEVRLNCHDVTDFLVYGITEEFLYATPDLLTYKVKKFSETVRAAGFLLYQAHPFRNGMTVTPPQLLDGIEVYNGYRDQPSRNDVAAYWAQRYQMRAISGSDYHGRGYAIDAGIRTASPLITGDDLLTALRERNYTLICEGTLNEN